jgi:hypothetical protein
MCELSNWNGRVYKISRNDILYFHKREDSGNTGIYFLFGKNEYNEDTVYVGEAEKIFSRLNQHLREDYRNNCVAVISKDNILNKAHIKYLENKFYVLAKDANRYTITNSNIPTCSSISEYDEAMLNEFIHNTKLLVNALGYKTFDPITQSTIKVNNNDLVFTINAARGASATGTIVIDGFTVFKDSVIASSTTPSMSESLIKLRQNLIDEKVINENYAFVKDYKFTSPSLAATVVMGRNANGRTEWKTNNGKPLRDVEENSENLTLD